MLKTPQIIAPKRQQTLNFQPSSSIQPRMSKTRETEDDGAEELILDALIGETCGDDDVLQERMTYQEVFDSVQGHLLNKKQPYLPRIIFDLHLFLKQYTAQLLKKAPFNEGRVKASEKVAKSNHLENDGKTLARRIRALFRHYQTFGGLPAETRGGKRNLDNEDVFQTCRAWLVAQDVGTVTPNNFHEAVNESRRNTWSPCTGLLFYRVGCFVTMSDRI
jgi:hypothetical protein